MNNDAVVKFQNQVVAALGWQCCKNCVSCDKNGLTNLNIPLCKEFNVTPPPDVILFGCNKHIYDIPF